MSLIRWFNHYLTQFLKQNSSKLKKLDFVYIEMKEVSLPEEILIVLVNFFTKSVHMLSNQLQTCKI